MYSYLKNPSIFDIDYDFLHQRINIIREELLEKTLHFQQCC